MCGIAGYLGRLSDGDVSGWLAGAAQRLAHRGPDGQGTWVAPGVGLVHTRLAILGGVAGSQPIQAGPVRLIFNGEIFNANDLDRRLGRHGQVASDTELLARWIAAHWTAGLDDLRGMFAFAAWHETRRELLLVRDRTGKKPLFIRTVDGGVAFGSEIQALTGLDAPLVTDRDALAESLVRGYVLEPRTLYRDVESIRPGHAVTIGAAGTRSELAFADLVAVPPVPVDEALRLAVERRLWSDRPVGVLLSGGLDSSAVAGVASALGARPRAFCVSFEEPAYDESRYAAGVARSLGLPFERVGVTPDELLDVDDLVRSVGGPFADSSAVGLRAAARRAARCGVPVLLGGDGGDEAFGGYQRVDWVRRWLTARRAAPRTSVFAAQAAGSVAGHLPVGGPRVARLAQAARRFASVDSPAGLDQWLRPLSVATVVALLGLSAPPDLPAPDWIDLDTGDVQADLLSWNMATYLVGDLLVKADRASMAEGVELRSPFLDEELLAAAAHLPAHDRTGKRALRKVASGYVDLRHVNPRKHGFGMPLGPWLREPAMADRLAERFRGLTVVDPEPALMLLHEHQSGDHDHGHGLWLLACLESWERQFVNAELVRRP